MRKSFLGNLCSIIQKTCDSPMKYETEKDRKFLRSMLEKDSDIQCTPLKSFKIPSILYTYLEGYKEELL